VKLNKFQTVLRTSQQANLPDSDEVPLQNTYKWYFDRLGKITASKFSVALNIIKEGSKSKGKTRKAYMIELAVERLTNTKTEGYTDKDMEWGITTEPQARCAYELDKKVQVEQVGFIEIDGMIGCSPDGLVGDDGLVEIKCPKSTTHLHTFDSGQVPAIHKAQLQGQMMVTNREWVDFVSFDPRLPLKAEYFCKRVMRDDEYIDNELRPGIEDFSKELDELIIKLK